MSARADRRLRRRRRTTPGRGHAGGVGRPLLRWAEVNQVGRYRVVRRIGAGGMAEVFEAVALGEEGWQRRVALKRLLPDVTDDEARRMFLDEARIAASSTTATSSPCSTTAWPTAARSRCWSTSTASTPAERDRREERALPADLALYVVIMVAHALEVPRTRRRSRRCAARHRPPRRHARQRVGGVVGRRQLDRFRHRPGAWSPDPHLGGHDQGDAELHGARAGLGRTGRRALDLFALGCVLHTLLTGASPLRNEDQLPWLAGTRELVVAPELPADLRALVARAIRRDPDQRFATAGEMIGALAAALAARGVVDGRSRLRAHLEPLRTPAPAELAPAPARAAGSTRCSTSSSSSTARTRADGASTR